jgi:PKHD-type hydroxylase
MSSVPTPLRVVSQLFLDGRHCDHILRGIDDTAWERGTIVRGEASERLRAPDVRGCAVQPVADPAVGAALRDFVARVNAERFGFDLDERGSEDVFALIRYQAGDRFDWHTDVGQTAPSNTRKLAFSLQLTPHEAYVGGDLQFAHMFLGSPDQGAPQSQVFRPRGSLVVFPAFLTHRVTPLTQGTRIALVGWVHGPAFR